MGKNQINHPLFKLLHYSSEHVKATGTYQSKRGTSLLGKFFWLFIKVPPTSSPKEFTLEIFNKGDKRYWKRSFNGKTFITSSVIHKDIFEEKKGICKFQFKIIQQEDKLHYRLKAFKILGLKVPIFLSISPSGHNLAITNNSWEFNIESYTSFGGLITKYWGKADI